VIITFYVQNVHHWLVHTQICSRLQKSFTELSMDVCSKTDQLQCIFQLGNCFFFGFGSRYSL